MRQEYRKWLWWLAVGLWTVVVFGFSSDRFSAESTSRFLAPLIQWLFPAISAETKQLLLSLARKGAHVFEYAVLGALAFQALRESSSPWRSAVLAVALVIAVAVADETHQAMSAARTGSAVDVSIDVAAGAGAVLLLLGVGRRIQVRRLQREASG
jgi:VanZ family protein